MAPGVLASLAVMILVTLLALAQVATGRRDRLPTLAVVGSLALVVAATVLPAHWSVGQGGAALALSPGHGGLGKGVLELVQGSPGSAAQLLVLNALVYVPLGAALCWAWPRRAWLLVVVLALSVTVEAGQYLVLARVAATDDVLVNCGGALAGWLAVAVGRRLQVGWRPGARPPPAVAEEPPGAPATSDPAAFLQELMEWDDRRG